jgi:hypothetical protein
MSRLSNQSRYVPAESANRSTPSLVSNLGSKHVTTIPTSCRPSMSSLSNERAASASRTIRVPAPKTLVEAGLPEPLPSATQPCRDRYPPRSPRMDSWTKPGTRRRLRLGPRFHFSLHRPITCGCLFFVENADDAPQGNREVDEVGYVRLPFGPEGIEKRIGCLVFEHQGRASTTGSYSLGCRRQDLGRRTAASGAPRHRSACTRPSRNRDAHPEEKV